MKVVAQLARCGGLILILQLVLEHAAGEENFWGDFK